MGISAVEIKEAADFIQSRINRAPAVAMILGSGLGDLAEEIEESVHIPYNEIPHFPVSTVEGHAGRLVIGKFQGKEVIAMQGRFHYYEGYSDAGSNLSSSCYEKPWSREPNCNQCVRRHE